MSVSLQVLSDKYAVDECYVDVIELTLRRLGAAVGQGQLHTSVPPPFPLFP